MTHTPKHTTIGHHSTYSITITALFTALTCISTMIIRIPTPTNGYVNLGDCFVLLSAFLLGPLYGGAAAGAGPMLADIFSGYTYYAPGTFIIKALMAVCAYYVYRLMLRAAAKHTVIAAVTAAVAAELIMVAGYFIFAGIFLGSGFGAISGVPGNIVQAVFAIITAPMLYALSKNLHTVLYR